MPIKHLLRELLDGPALDPTSLAGRLDETLQVVTITPEEDRLLARAGLASRMSDEEGIYARHQQAGIDPAGFAPLGE